MWDIWPRSCRPAMERFLRRHAEQFKREGCSVDLNDILHPIHDQVASSSRCFPPLYPWDWPCMERSEAERLVATEDSLPGHSSEQLRGVSRDCVRQRQGMLT